MRIPVHYWRHAIASLTHQLVYRLAPTATMLVAIGIAAFLLTGYTPQLNATSMQDMDHPAIEWLKFRVPPQQQDLFLQKDAEIWTPVLSDSPGFTGKEVWQNSNHADEVILVIHWSSREEWKAIPQDLLEQTNQRFNEAVGADYPLVEAKEFRPVTEPLS
jgi:uncharacterized protein (TIGR03792 family)